LPVDETSVNARRWCDRFAEDSGLRVSCPGRGRSVVSGYGNAGASVGLPLDRRRRLPIVDRQSISDDGTVDIAWDFQPQGDYQQ